MRLSIIIPVFNVEAYVGETLKSVFDTTAPMDSFEVIVVNDGCKDGSMGVVRQFADRPNLTILEQENQGLSLARMNGLALAKGEYVWFVDSDDYLVDDGVWKVLKQLDAGQNDDVLLFPCFYVYEKGKREELEFVLQKEEVVLGKNVIRDLGIPVYPTQRFVLKRSLFNNPWLLFPPGLLHEDEYFGPVLMYLAERVHLLKDPVYFQRCRSGSIMSSMTVRSAYDKVSIHQLLMKFLESVVGPEDNGWFRSYCCRRMVNSYARNSSYFGTPAFKQFVHEKGGYVWVQWRQATPDASLLIKIQKFLFFSMPVFYASAARCFAYLKSFLNEHIFD